MTGRDLTNRLDRFARSSLALWLAFAWGLAEATFFFIVPDVLMTFIACRTLRSALRATVAALVGALVGGAVMYSLGLLAPDSGRLMLNRVPGISPELIARVSSELGESGLFAVMLGPLKGVPYKIYAVEWGSLGGSAIPFLLVSIPARYARFFLATITAQVIARILKPVTHQRASVEVSILAVVWIAFYAFYFASFGF